MATKLRLSASVDARLVEAGRAAVSAGKAENLSAWVNQALARQAEHDRGLRALAEYIAEYEAEHGEITQADMDRVDREDRARAIVVRSGEIIEPQTRVAA